MAVPIYDARDTVYRSGVNANNQPRRPDYAWPAVTPDAGSGGLPWFRGKPSPYNPSGPASQYVEPYEEQGPPDLRSNQGAPGMFANLSPADLIALGTALTSVIGDRLSNRNQPAGTSTQTNDPQLQELMALMQNRLKKSEPLYDSVLAMGNGLLPTAYQRDNPLLGGPYGGTAAPGTSGPMLPDERTPPMP